MSYCRFSSDNWTSDVYCYEHVDGSFVTHVAGNRAVGDVPKVPPFPDDDPDGKDEWIAEYVVAHNAQMAFLEACQRVPIGLPHDGETFADTSASWMLARLLLLQEIGYQVPAFAIEAVFEEAYLDPTDPITSQERYNAAMIAIHHLMDRNPTPESREGEMLGKLADLAERYEKAMYPHLRGED